MTRLTLVLATWIGLVSGAPASLGPRPDRLHSGNDGLQSLAPQLSAESSKQPGPATASDYQVTEQTEVLLDGKACRFEAVPEYAAIERMVVAPDGKTVLRVYFQTRK